MLNSVSETALITLKARAVETEKALPLIQDPHSLGLLNKMKSLELSRSQQAILDRNLPPSLSSYIALRARKYDAWAIEFLSNYPSGLVVNLGAGFDTRFWRIPVRPDQYYEVDLPEVVTAKKQLLDRNLDYHLIDDSVLMKKWMKEISLRQKEGVLFLAEGLLMYLPEKDVIHFFQELGGSFSDSQIVFEVVHKKYTRGMRKKMVESKMKRRGGTEAGTSYQYGITKGEEVESYASNFKLIEEWSYFEDPELRPASLRLLRHFKAFSRTQWTVRAKLV